MVILTSAEGNLRLMKTLDDAWNAGPYSPRWETFRKRHKEDVKVYWPNQPEPTKGRYDHYLQAVEFFKNFNTVFLTTPTRSLSVTGTTRAPWPIGWPH